MCDAVSDADEAIAAMDWGPGGIVEGTAEADAAATALVSAVLTLSGASAGPSDETEMQRLWRCGELRSVSPSAVPLLRSAIAEPLQGPA